MIFVVCEVNDLPATEKMNFKPSRLFLCGIITPVNLNDSCSFYLPSLS